MLRSKLLQAVLVAASVGAFAAPALADPHHDRDRDRDHHHHVHRGYAYDPGPGYVYAPPPVVYAPPPAPPGLNIIVPLRFH